MNIEILKASEIDYDRGVARFMGDNELYQSQLIEFLSDNSVAAALSAYENGNWSQCFDSIHTLKGVAGNLDMTELYAMARVLSDLLRNNNSPDLDALEHAFHLLMMAYETVCVGISAAQEC